MKIERICNGKGLVVSVGDREVLQSYETIVLSYDSAKREFQRHWAGWSMTTGRHIKEFAQRLGVEKPNKTWWDSLEVTPFVD